MNPAQQYDKKRKFIQQQQDDDEQIERTLKYFDSILDEYLYDNDISDENTIQKSYSQTRFVNDVPVQLMKQNGHVSEPLFSIELNRKPQIFIFFEYSSNLAYFQ